jgi:hypothetical protein
MNNLKEKIEMKKIEEWFKNTDYYANKIIRGEWSEDEPKWVAYKKEARKNALRLEEIKVILKQNK